MSKTSSSEYRDASGRLVCIGKTNIDYDQFAKIAEKLTKQFNGEIVEKMDDGFSTRHWDVMIDKVKVCFHFHDMILDFEIISLEENKSNELAKKLATALA